MLLLSDTMQATSLHREASESGREARKKIHEGTFSEGYMGRKEKAKKKRKKRREYKEKLGVILITNNSLLCHVSALFRLP